MHAMWAINRTKNGVRHYGLSGRLGGRAPAESTAVLLHGDLLPGVPTLTSLWTPWTMNASGAASIATLSLRQGQRASHTRRRIGVTSCASAPSSIIRRHRLLGRRA